MKSQAKNKPKILVVDDEPDNLDLLYRTFRRNYKVLRAESGPAALEILSKEGDIAVIISDQRMPMMSGTEFLSLTASQYPDIIRIILTGYTDVEDLVEAINTGKVFKYVTKPWDADELEALVVQAMDTHNVLKARTQELYRSLRQESLLNTVTNTIRSALSYQELLQTIVDTVGHMLEASCCILRPFQEDRLQDEWFIYSAAEGGPITRDSAAAPCSTEIEATLAQTVWETREVQAITNVETEDRPHNEQRLTAYRSADIRSSLIVPLLCKQELMAVLALHQCSQTRVWQDDEVQLVVMVADQAALALAQARAYEQVRSLATREVLINTITTAIRSSLDPQDIFAAITQQLGQALRVDGCALSLWTEEDEFVRCVGLHITEDETKDGETKGSPQVDHHSLLKGEFPTPPLQESASKPALPQSTVPIAGNPVLKKLLETQEPVSIPDLNQRSDMSGFDLPLRSRARALLVVPLLSDGKIIGSISLRQTHQPRYWQIQEIALAQAVAAQAAIAVQQSRLYQKTRQQAERLLELDQQKTEFFQNVSHEFRTPLTLMIGPLESAVGQGEGLPADQSAIALRNSRRLLRLVNQLLDLQRLDAGRMQANFRPCNLEEFTDQIVETFRPYCQKKGLSLATDLQACPPIYLDVERFDKVIYNLLSNAMKFTESGGSITVKLAPAGEQCRLQVKDTGIGIRSEQLPHLFERFRQAEGSVNRSHEGSGLGLALVKELVELHGGQVSVESVYGEGTIFTIWLQTGTAHLPMERTLEVAAELRSHRAGVELADLETELEGKQQEAGAETWQASPSPTDLDRVEAASNADTATATEAEPDCSPGKILVVDDNPDLRTYVSSILLKAGHEIVTARNGAEGIQVAREHHPDLVVTDLMMPLVSGLDLIRSIREDDSLKGTPVILLTAKVDEDTRIEGTERGADAYLAKPFNDRELLALVRNLLALKENERQIANLNRYLTGSVLSRFLPAPLVDKAAAGDLSLDLRPEPRLITILFSDIVGFTQISNTLRSRRVAELLNEYLEAMTEAIFANGGTVDKFMGDAVLAIFGAPEELSPNEQVRRAIAAGRQMRQMLDQLNESWQEKGLVGTHGRAPRVQFRCGIHQGTAVVGMFGSKERADYTAIGPSVNIASRLQEAAEPGTILVSAAVADYLDEEEIIKCSPLHLKGVDETVLTFALKLNAASSDDLPLTASS